MTVTSWTAAQKGEKEYEITKIESCPRHWTHQDDCKAILDPLSAGRIRVDPIFSRAEQPENAPEVYRQLAEDNKNFPMGTVFDWRKLNEN